MKFTEALGTAGDAITVKRLFADRTTSRPDAQEARRHVHIDRFTRLAPAARPTREPGHFAELMRDVQGAVERSQ